MSSILVDELDAGPVLADAVAQLDSALARVADLAGDGALTRIPPAALAPLAVHLLRAADRAQAVATVATGAVHLVGDLPDGHVSTKRWLEAAAHLSPTEAGTTLTRELVLRQRYHATEAAWLAGQISGGIVRTITVGTDLAVRTLPACERDRQAEKAEHILLALGERGSVADVAKAVGRLRLATDPDGMRQAALDACDDQQLRFRPLGAGYAVDGFLTAEGTALVLTALERQTDQWQHDGTLAEIDRTGGDDPVSRRCARLRRPHLLALALTHLLGRALESGDLGTHHSALPRVVLTADLADLRAGVGGELLLPGHDSAELLPNESVARFLCDAEVTAIVTSRCTRDDDVAWLLRDHDRSVLWVGRAQRVVTPRLRRALEARDRHCAFPGCGVDVSRTRAHHVIPWEQGGSTDVDNLVLVCERHHHAVHEGGRTVGLVSDPRRSSCWRFSPPHRRPGP